MVAGVEKERSDVDAFHLIAGGLSNTGAWRGVGNASEDTGETIISKTHAFLLFFLGTALYLQAAAQRLPSVRLLFGTTKGAFSKSCCVRSYTYLTELLDKSNSV